MNMKAAEKLYRSMDNVRKIFFENKKRGELSKSEMSMLHFIKLSEQESGNITTAELSKRLKISKSATSQTLNILEDKQLIQRRINREDRRLMCVTLTEKGKQILEKQMQRFLKNMTIVFDKMGEEDSELFVDLLDKFLEKLKEFKQEQNSSSN